MRAGTDLSLAVAGGEVASNLREYLRGLDQILDRRAASIEAELHEITLVRKRIEFYLTPAANGIRTGPPPSGSGGANLGQMI